MKKIIASAPGKLMLFGEHSVVYGYPCIVTAIDKRVMVTVELNTDENFWVNADEVGVINYSKKKSELCQNMPNGVRFIETLYKIFLVEYPQTDSIKVTVKSDFSNRYGFGSSSAVTVAFAKALISLYELKLTKEKLFDLCYRTILAVQGRASGFDVASAIWGGTIYYVPQSCVVKKLDIKKLPLTVIYTGVKANTVELIQSVKKIKEIKPDYIEDVFYAITMLVERAPIALLNENWNEVSVLMKENQNLLRKLNISTEKIEQLISILDKNGFGGVKISGAGGGDCLIAISNNLKQNNFRYDIEMNGGEIVPVNFNSEGVRIEYAE